MTYRIDPVALVKPVFRIAHREALKAAIARPATLVAYAVPMALASILTVIAIVAITPDGHLLFANGDVEFVDLTRATQLTLLAVLAPVLLIANVFASAAAQLTITAALLSRPIGVGEAWRRSARILLRTLPAGLLVVVLAAIAVLIAIVTAAVGLPVWAAGLILFVLLMLLYPVLYLFSLNVLRPTPLRSAWRNVARVGKAINEEGMVARIPLVLTIAVGTGLTLLITVIEGTVEPSVWMRALFGIAVSVIAVLAAVAAIGVLSRLTLEGLSRQDDPGSVQLPAAIERSLGRTAGAWAVFAVAVALPFTFLAGSITVNPTNVPVTSAVSFDRGDIDLVTLDAGDGVIANLSHAYGDNSLAVCVDLRCEAALDVVRNGFITAMAPVPTGGVIVARWTIGPENDDGQEWILGVSTLTASQLVSAAREDVTDDADIELEISEIHTIDEVSNTETGNSILKDELYSLLALTIDTSGEFPVIASLNGLATPDVRELSIYRCTDTECTSATKQSLVVDVQTSYSSLLSLDLAVSSDGTAFATLTGFERLDQQRDLHTTTLFTAGVSGPMTANHIVVSEPTTATYEDGWAPSQIVIGNDGTPSLLYRLERTGEFELMVCDDAACSSSTSRTLPGPVSENFVPSMTVDSSGRPLIATYSENGQSVVVLSCIDAACSSFESRVVQEAYRAITPVNIAMSSGGLPIVTLGRWGVEHTVEKIDEATLLVQCQQARCGAK